MKGIRASVHHLLHLCKNFIAYQSIQQKTFVTVPGAFVLNESIKEVVETYRAHEQHRGIDLKYQEDPSLPYSVKVDTK